MVAPAGAFVPAPLFDRSQLSLRVLPNGVRSIVKAAPGSGLVAVQVWVRAGSRHEFADQGGAAHLMSVACLKASDGYSQQSGGAATAIQSLGGTSFSQTSRDATNFSATVSVAHADKAVRILADAVLRPDLSEATLATDKDAARRDIQVRESDALSVSSDLSYAAGFSAHPYRRSPLGQITDIDALTFARLKAFQQERYTGANISVVVVGDVSASRAHELVAQSFASAPRALPGARTQFGTPEAAPLKPRTIRRMGTVARPTVALSFRAPGLDAADDVVALDVLIAHWQEGRDAVLRRTLMGAPDDADEANNDESSTRSDAGAPVSPPIALGLDIAFLTQRDPSLITFSLVTEQSNASRAVTTTFAEIARVRASGITSAQLERAKRVLRRQYVAQDETAAGQAGALGFYDMIGSYEFAAQYLDRINRVSIVDIKRVATRYLVPSSAVAILIVPEPAPKVPLNNPEDGGVSV
ncbi:MAG TPA: pitrilysin family protein [Abditibacteriaceae bacterium]|nr:pitrilysin family protein [Abditibacteriaceae bacterium]